MKGLSTQGTVPEWYYHFDGLGSVTELTDSTGAVIEKYQYDAFGNTLIKNASDTVLSESAVGNHFAFTGRELDPETGLYYYRARYYSPKLGRFLQTDPLEEDDENLYAYCYNDPVNYVDPYGLLSLIIGGGTAVGVGVTPPLIDPKLIGIDVIDHILRPIPGGNALPGAQSKEGVKTSGQGLSEILTEQAQKEGKKDEKKKDEKEKKKEDDPKKEHRKKHPHTWDKHTKQKPGDPEKGDERRPYYGPGKHSGPRF